MRVELSVSLGEPSSGDDVDNNKKTRDNYTKENYIKKLVMSSELSGFATKKTKEKKIILVFSHFDFAALLLYSLYFSSSAAAADSHIQQTPYTPFSALLPFSLSASSV